MVHLGDDLQPVEYLEALIEADKRLVQQLKRDIDALDEELGRLEEACQFEEDEVKREEADSEGMRQESQHFVQQLEVSQRQLNGLKVEHQVCCSQGVSLWRDRAHYGNEIAFLNRLLDEGMRDTQALQQSIEYLEKSNHSLIAHTKSLEAVRREVLEQVWTEKASFRKEQTETNHVKQVLEALRSGDMDHPILGGSEWGNSFKINEHQPSRPTVGLDIVADQRGALWKDPPDAFVKEPHAQGASRAPVRINLREREGV